MNSPYKNLIDELINNGISANAAVEIASAIRNDIPANAPESLSDFINRLKLVKKAIQAALISNALNYEK